MKYRRLTPLILVAGMLLSVGCAHQPPKPEQSQIPVPDKPVTLPAQQQDAFGRIETCLGGAIDLSAVLKLDSPADIDAFLDCGLGEAPDHELAMLRGHMVVTLMAHWGVMNVWGKMGDGVSVKLMDSESPEQAADILQLVELSSSNIRNASNLYRATPVCKGSLTPKGDRVSKRLYPAIALASKVEQPTVHRGRRAVLRLINAVATGSLLDGIDAVKQGLNGVKKLALAKPVLSGYIQDARDGLEVLRLKYKGKPESCKALNTWKADLTAYWAAWDKILGDACDNLALIAGQPSHRCLRE